MPVEFKDDFITIISIPRRDGSQLVQANFTNLTTESAHRFLEIFKNLLADGSYVKEKSEDDNKT